MDDPRVYVGRDPGKYLLYFGSNGGWQINQVELARDAGVQTSIRMTISRAGWLRRGTSLSTGQLASFLENRNG